MVPNGWTQKKLGDMVRIYTGVAPADLELTDKGALPYVKVEDMNNCLKYQKTSRSYAENSENFIPKGAVIFPKRGAAILNNKVRISTSDFLIDSNMMAIKPDESLSSEFLYYLITYLKLYKIADTSTIPQINNKHIAPLRVTVPALQEQESIAKILSSWDQAITITEQLLTNSQQQKKVLTRQLLSGKKRLPGFFLPWKTLPINNCLVESALRNSDSTFEIEDIRSVNKAEGMIPMREETIGKSIDRYKVVKAGWFAYNPMRINVGSICRWDKESDCLVSPDYVVFSCNELILLGSYFDQFRKSERWKDYMDGAGRGSVRVRIYLKDLSKLDISLPDICEQKKIIQVLTTADREIEILQKKLTCLKQEKKALMQQLLTGKRRVKVEAA